MPSADAATECRNRLLGPTIAHAIFHVPLYRELWGNVIAPDIFCIERLPELPTIDKATIVDAGEAAHAKSVTTTGLQYTSGTTGRSPILHRGTEEQAAIDQFFGALLGRRSDTGGPKALVMALHAAVHGGIYRIAGDSFVIEACVLDRWTAANTVRLLEERYDLPGWASQFSLITGALAQLVLLTQYICEAGYDIGCFNIRALAAIGAYVSEPYHTYLKSVWKCPVFDRYSLTEVFEVGTSTRESDIVFDTHVIPGGH